MNCKISKNDLLVIKTEIQKHFQKDFSQKKSMKTNDLFNISVIPKNMDNSVLSNRVDDILTQFKP